MTRFFTKERIVRALTVLPIALGVAIVPATSFAAPTSATDVADSNVTITGLLAGDTLSVFRVADANIDARNNLSWTMTPGLPQAYDTPAELGKVASDGTRFVQGSAAQRAASAIAAALKNPTTTVNATGTEARVTLGSGYYLLRVTSTSGTSRVYQNMLVDLSPVKGTGTAYAKHPDVSMAVKSSEVTLEKKVGADQTDSTDKYSVGDKVPFRVSTAIPSYPADSLNATFTVGDTPSAGLEIVPSSIMINGVAAKTGADYTLTASATGWTIAYAKNYVLANPGKAVVVTYEAKLTSAAFSRSATDLTGNTATVTFNPNPYNATTKTPSTTTKVKTYGYVFKKVTPEDRPLPGAVFTLTLANGTKLTSTSDSNGYVYFEDLAAGTYTITETTVPAGYQAVAPQKFTLSATTATKDNPATKAIENNYLVATANLIDPKQPTMPVTGAQGIALLVGAGTVLFVAGFLLLMPARRKK